MKAIQALAVRHPVVAYFVLTFAISWSGVLMVISGSGGLSTPSPTGDPRFIYALVAMLAGPSLSGLVLMRIVHGKNAWRSVGSRVLAWRVPMRWYVAALLTAPAVWLATTFVLSFFSEAFVPAVIGSTGKGPLVMAGVTVALAAGVFEEIGWTGFATPEMRRNRGVFATGFIVGVLWGAWHLLVTVFWAGRLTAGDLPLPVFMTANALTVLVGYLAAFRVLMVWVYERTGSLFVAMLMHVSLTASVLILDPLGLSGAAMLVYAFALALAVWLIVAVVGAHGGWRAQHVSGFDRRAA
jgi:CAAX protease family protein